MALKLVIAGWMSVSAGLLMWIAGEALLAVYLHGLFVGLAAGFWVCAVLILRRA